MGGVKPIAKMDQFVYLGVTAVNCLNRKFGLLWQQTPPPTILPSAKNLWFSNRVRRARKSQVSNGVPPATSLGIEATPQPPRPCVASSQYRELLFLRITMNDCKLLRYSIISNKSRTRWQLVRRQWANIRQGMSVSSEFSRIRTNWTHTRILLSPSSNNCKPVSESKPSILPILLWTK